MKLYNCIKNYLVAIYIKYQFNVSCYEIFCRSTYPQVVHKNLSILPQSNPRDVSHPQFFLRGGENCSSLRQFDVTID